MKKFEYELTNCLRPFRVEVTRNSVTVPMYIGCGRCVLCMQANKNQWVFRLEQTAKHSKFNYFVTLTYDDEHLPEIGDNGSYNITCFLKRVRKKTQLPENFKYYFCTELGEKYGRLHHHAILFNTGCSFLKIREIIKRDWPYGFIDVKEVNSNRIKYVTKYCVQMEFRKKVFKWHGYELNSDGVPEYVVKKEKPVNYFVRRVSHGMGIEFLTPSMVEYLRRRGDGTFYDNGYLKQLPRYYLEKVFQGEELEKIRDNRFNHKALQSYEELEKYSEYNFARSWISDGLTPTDRQLAIVGEFRRKEEKAAQIRRRSKHYRFIEAQRTVIDHSLILKDS